MRLPLWSWRPFRPRWSYTSANAELALNGLLRFGTALCTSVLPRGLFSSNTSHFVTRRVTPPRVPASSRPTRSRPRPPRARATRHNAKIERCIKIAPAARLCAAPPRPHARLPRRRPPVEALPRNAALLDLRAHRRLSQALAPSTHHARSSVFALRYIIIIIIDDADASVDAGRRNLYMSQQQPTRIVSRA